MKNSILLFYDLRMAVQSDLSDRTPTLTGRRTGAAPQVWRFF
jgi:hypothetical protein